MSDLKSIRERFVTHWGEMGARWGVDHPVARVHAFLYLAPQALSAAEISSALNMPEQAVTQALNELLIWKLAHEVRDNAGVSRYSAEHDVFTMLQLIADQRKKRELDPTIEMLQGLQRELSNLEDNTERQEMQRGISDLLEFLESVGSLYDRGKKLPLSLVKKLLKLDQKLEKLLHFL